MSEAEEKRAKQLQEQYAKDYSGNKMSWKELSNYRETETPWASYLVELIFEFCAKEEAKAVSLVRKEQREQTMKNCLEGIATEKVLRLWCSDCQKFTKVSHNPKHTTTKIYEHLLSKFTTEVEARVREEEREKFIKELEGLAKDFNSKKTQKEMIKIILPWMKKLAKEIRLQTAKEILEWMKSGEQNLISANSEYGKDFKNRFLSKPQTRNKKLLQKYKGKEALK